MKEFGIGIIGWGFMGKTHTLAIRSLPLFYSDAPFRARLVGVCSHTLSKAEKARDDLGFAYATDDYHVLLNDPAIDVVSICTPNGLHEKMAVEALAAGKNVYIDKPLAVCGAEAENIEVAAQSAPGKMQVVLHNRFFPATMRAKELVQQGFLGELLSFSCRYLHSGSIDPAKPMGWKQGPDGGVLLDIGSHALDLLTWLVGMPEKVLCEMNTIYDERPTREGGFSRAISEDHALMMLRYANGALGTVEASKIATGSPDELRLEVCGTKGAIRWNLADPGWLEVFDNTAPEVPLGGFRGFTRVECLGRFAAPGGLFLPSKNAIGWERAHTHCYYSFLDALNRGAEPSPSVHEAVVLQRLMDACARSASTHSWQQFTE